MLSSKSNAAGGKRQASFSPNGIYDMRVLCAGGGPGFNPAYLARAVAGALDGEVIAFRPKNPTQDFPQRVEDFRDQLFKLNADGPFAIVAHSWGCLLTTAALVDPAQFPNLSSHLLINPVPMEREQFRTMTSRLRERIAFQKKVALLIRAMRNDGRSIIRILLPFYGIQPTAEILDELALDVREYHCGMRNISWLAGDQLLRVYAMSSVIRGDEDITHEDLITPLLTAAGATQEIENAGHFPMYDQPLALARALKAWVNF